MDLTSHLILIVLTCIALVLAQDSAVCESEYVNLYNCAANNVSLSGASECIDCIMQSISPFNTSCASGNSGYCSALGTCTCGSACQDTIEAMAECFVQQMSTGCSIDCGSSGTKSSSAARAGSSGGYCTFDSRILLVSSVAIGAVVLMLSAVV